MSMSYDTVLFEFCCEETSELSQNVGHRALSIRITQGVDATSSATKKAIHHIIRVAAHLKIAVHGWVSVPCTAGCPWARVNNSLGVQTGDPELTDDLIVTALAVCRHIDSVGGYVHWEWPQGNALWNRDDVQQFLHKIGAAKTPVSTAAAGMNFRTKSEM